MNKALIKFLMTSVAGVIAMSSAANAGGFAVREQSASSMGASYAGNAAGGDLSSMFWNPAALGASKGTNAESHFSVFIADTELTADGPGAGAGALNNFNPLGASLSSGDIAQEAIIPASYFGMQLSPVFWAGLAINSPFGLVTKPEDRDWIGGPIARKSKVFTINANPNVALQVMPGVVVGVGLQVQYMDAELKFGAGFPAGGGAPSAVFEGHDIGFGGTAGIYLTPAEGTQIGIGYRSQVTQQLEGSFGVVGFPSIDSSVELVTPDMVTVSIRQAVSPSMRLMATFEWTNWSDFEILTVVPVGLAINANWNDAWFASVGAEFDITDALTVRGGVAYEESPVDTPQQRLTPVPDSDRLWVSVGATYQFSEHTALDFSYSHVFVDDARFDRDLAVAAGVNLTGSAESDVDLIAFSIKSKLDENHPILGGLF